VQVAVSEWNANVLGLSTVVGVAERPSAVLALVEHAPLAEVAGSAGRDAGDQHSVALFQAFDFGADLMNNTDAFMAQGATRFYSRHVTQNDVQIGTCAY